MPLRQPLVHRGRQQKAGLAVNRAEVAHASDVRGSQVRSVPLFYRTIPRRVKSDRLLNSHPANAATRELPCNELSSPPYLVIRLMNSRRYLVIGTTVSACVGMPLRHAYAESVVNVFDPPSSQLSIQPPDPGHPLYGHDVAAARWHIAQWNNPDGGIPDLINGRSRNGSMAFATNSGPRISYVITQDGGKLRCSDVGSITEFDGLIGTNTARNNPGTPSAEGHVPLSLSRYLSLTQKISLTVQAAAFIKKPRQCLVSKAISFVCIVLNNTRRRSTFFYQVILASFGTAPRVVWWARGNRNSRYGYNDLATSFGQRAVSAGTWALYKFDALPRLRALIERNKVGMDPEIGDWYISGAYFGNAIWGDVRLSTEWADYALRGAVHPYPCTEVSTGSLWADCSSGSTERSTSNLSRRSRNQ